MRGMATLPPKSFPLPVCHTVALLRRPTGTDFADYNENLESVVFQFTPSREPKVTERNT